MLIFKNRHEKILKTSLNNFTGFEDVKTLLDYLFTKKQKVKIYLNNLGEWEIKTGNATRIKKQEEQQEEQEEQEEKEEKK